jgi:hypothetical protein
MMVAMHRRLTDDEIELLERAWYASQARPVGFTRI